MGSGRLLLAFVAWLTTSTTASINPEAEHEAVRAIDPTPQNTTEIPAVTQAPDTWIRHTIKRNETLGTIFEQYAFDPALPLELTRNAEGSRLKNIRVGRELRFKVDENNRLLSLVYPVDTLNEFVVAIDPTERAHTYNEQSVEYTTSEVLISGTIDTSLYEAADQNGVPIPVIMQMVEIFGWDIDFAIDLREGDSFKLIFEEHFQADEKLGNGNIIAAEFVNRGELFQAFRFTDSEDNASYYTPAGESMRGTFLRTPVEFSRISSRFSRNRFHPILKKWRSHKGVDYAAARGTPIRATADGTVTHVGRKGGYGKTVIVSHAGRVQHTVCAYVRLPKRPAQG